MVRPTSRPGTWRTSSARGREQAQVRAAVLERDAERLALADGDVRAVLAGRRQDGERDRLDDGHEQRARGVGEARRLGHRLEDAERVGLAEEHARDGPVGVGELALEGREVGRAVGERGQLLERQPAALEVGRASCRGSGDGRRG